MLKTRLIPVLLLQNGLLVRSQSFKSHHILGDPISQVRRFNEWCVDELIYLDISTGDLYDLRRDDQLVRGLSHPMAILEAVSATCMMPLTWGGRIRTLEDMDERFRRGADKIVISTAAVQSPELVTAAARRFGGQAVVACVDVRRHPDGRPEVFIDGGGTPTGRRPEEWARELQERGAGEILLQSIDRDGEARGYDLDLIGAVSAATRIPVIALGGVGREEHFAEGIRAGASAAAAANLWHFKELMDRRGKRAMAQAGIPIRPFK